MERFKVAQVARELNITPAAVYKKLKTCCEQVENQTFKEKGITYITRAGLEALRASLQKPVPESVSTRNEPVDNQVESMEKRLTEQNAIIQGLQKTLDTLIAQHGQERERSDTIIMKLSNDIGKLQKALEFRESPNIPADPPKRVEAWKPETPKDPLEGLGVFQRAWVKLFRPVCARRFDS